MQSHLGGAKHVAKRESDDSESLGHHVHTENAFKEHVDTTSHEEDSVVADASDDDNQSSEEAQNQLVVYDPLANGGDTIEAVPESLVFPPVPRYSTPSTPPKVLPSIGAFTVQCASCFKWRLIPTKEKYEEIREHILEQPFVCEAAREWRPETSCEDPADILQDGSRVWAIDKPNIAQPPPGWERLLRIRAEGSTKFADVYVFPYTPLSLSLSKIHTFTKILVCMYIWVCICMCLILVSVSPEK
ncbi:Zinc finger, CW-type [Dillenia turbinata]|uniref:Zinc finger, CW-type n=1 Tax=Dillenia turbinata TaxID=194707 RepID=A0AAN8ZKD6_9MAGN